ncbi:hypothetical protein HNR65_003446 [Desulfosalsimonas propionicica]|uniref:ParB/Sulfiredoxin domain-containing protein n=1 Tax=Desulfosalsimonas propionicica TaxID=332175 RepID=A0A7W0CCH7_9BACT|nr:ParB N-terminal domain-containing protein [Desulfosalsimonas propionicica]MBA2883089.1 hypothetical protein [Desulfosalsimonas propionicica]
MTYLEKLKSKISPPGELQKPQKGFEPENTPTAPTAKTAKTPFYTFCSTRGRRFSGNQDPAQNKGGTFIVVDDLDPHAVTGIVPEMDAETFAGFKADIQAKGLLEPVVLFQGEILDGRARYRACKELGRPVVARKWEGGMDPVDFIRAVNLLRSHNVQGQGTGLKIEPLTTCLHGKPCPHLDAPGGDKRPACLEAMDFIFDMGACPLNKWKQPY